MKAHFLTLALVLALFAGIRTTSAQEATPAATENAAGTAATGALLDFLKYVPDTADTRSWLSYGDKAAWLESWGIPNAQNLDAVKALDPEASRRWMMILPRQTVPGTALGIESLAIGDDLPYYGFDYFSTDRYLEAGLPPNLITVVDGQFNASRIDSALKTNGYTTTALKPSGTLYSSGEDYALNLTSDAPRVGQLGARNRIALIGQRLLLGRATGAITSALSAAAGTVPSLGDAPDYQAAVAALNDAKLSDAGTLVGVVMMAQPPLPDPAALVGNRLSQEQIDQIKDKLGITDAYTPFTLGAFASYHTAGKTSLVMALVFPSGTDADKLASELGTSIQQYDSILTARPFLDSIHAQYDRAFGLTANGLPVAVVVLTAPDPAADSTVVPDWVQAIVSRDLGFLYVNSEGSGS